MDLLRAAHGPWNMPATKAEQTMLISCHVFNVQTVVTRTYLEHQITSKSQV
jgi:hypothetical protein